LLENFYKQAAPMERANTVGELTSNLPGLDFDDSRASYHYGPPKLINAKILLC
jgi:hypothetical protein